MTFWFQGKDRLATLAVFARFFLALAVVLLPAMAGAQLHRLLLREGVSIEGQLIKADADVVAWRSGLFLEDVDIPVNAIDSIRFSAPQAASKDAFRIELIDGNIFFGNLVKATKETVVISSSRLGTINVPRNRLATISRCKHTLFSGPRGLSGWVVSKDETFNSSWRSNRSGHLLTSTKDATVFYPLKPTGDIDIHCELSATGPIRFALGLEKTVEASLRLETLFTELILAGPDDFEPVQSLEDDARFLSLRMTWHHKSKQLVVYSPEGEELAKLSDSAIGGFTGLSLVNKGEDLRLTRLHITQHKQDGFPDHADRVVLSNGDSLEGALRWVEGEKATWAVGDNLAKTFSVEDIYLVRFANQLVTPSDTFKHARLFWADGTVLSGKRLGETEDGKLRIRCESLPNPVSAAQEGIDSLFFASPTASATIPNRDSHKDHLFVNSQRLFGQLTVDQQHAALAWKLPYSDRNYRLNTASNFRIVQGETPQLTWKLDDFPNRVVLTGSSSLPCRILSMDEKELRCQSPLTGEIRIPVDQVKALDIGSRILKRRFTNESLARALTVPASQKEDPFTHVLIATNGDLLRGRLVKITTDAVLFESRLSVVRVARNRISTLVRVAHSKKDRSPSSSPDSDQVELILRGGYRLRLNVESVSGDKIIGKLLDLWECSVSLGCVEQVLFGGATIETSAVADYSDWTIRDAEAPRWGDEEKGPPPDVLKVVGRKLEAFELPSLDGKSYRSDAHAGKVVVLLHWATWANPCKRALPAYQDAFSSFSADDVVLVGINRGESPRAVREYFKEHDLTDFDTLLDHRLLMFNRLQVTSLPTIVIVGRDGTVEAVQAGYSIDGAEQAKQIASQILAGKWQRPVAPQQENTPETETETQPETQLQPESTSAPDNSKPQP